MRLSTFLLLTAPLTAQDIFDQGSQVFKLSCAQGYCHGSGGTQGRAPKLIGRQYEQAFVIKTVQEGIPNTGMPGFKANLESSKLNAVVAYVLKVSGGDTSKVSSLAAGAAAETMPVAAKRGKDLFFDAYKGIRRCGTCHSLEGMGIAVGPNLASGGPYPSTLRLATTKSGENFPALLVSQYPGDVRVYDLTAPPPVLRTFAKGEITLSSGAAWTHGQDYTASERENVNAYLKWIAAR